MKFTAGIFAAALAGVSAQNSTIVELAVATPSLSTLVSILTDDSYAPYTAIKDALNAPGTYTVFAPTNDAFTALGLDCINTEANKPVCAQTLYYHVLGAAVESGDLAALQFPETLMTDATYVTRNGAGQQIQVTSDANGVQINWGFNNDPSTVSTADVIASNGVVHIVDTVISPFPKLTSDTATDAGLSTLVSAVVDAGLADAVNTTPDVTIFAPTNDAFTAATGIAGNENAVLTYHVVPAVAFSNELTDGQMLPTLNGGMLKVVLIEGAVFIEDELGGRAQVTTANVITQNGVVHVVDSVLKPKDGRAADDIVSIAADDAELSTLVSILTDDSYAPYTAIKDALSAAGNYTVFAPTNDAFTALGLDCLAEANKPVCAQTLYYHVLGATVESGDLAALQFPETLMTDATYVTRNGAGQQIQVTKDETNGVQINWGLSGPSTVGTADVLASNGVVHKIDTVISPFPALVSATATTAGLSDLVSAVVANNLTSAVDTTPDVTIFAPTNAAFAAANLTGLDVSGVLQYHVVPAVAFSNELTNDQKLSTLQNEELTVKITDGKVFIEDASGGMAEVTTANVITQNGVVHVIDSVLVPTFSSAATTGAGLLSAAAVVLASAMLF